MTYVYYDSNFLMTNVPIHVGVEEERQEGDEGNGAGPSNPRR